MNRPPSDVIEAARVAAMRSPCAKSKRGAALFNREDADRLAANRELYPQAITVVVASGFNGQPTGFGCSGSEACRRDCSKLCLHAEQRAIWSAGALDDLVDLELVHVKVVDGQVVPGDGPSCWQCSRLIVEVDLRGIWLFEHGHSGDGEPPVWIFYSAAEFHRTTLQNCGLGES